VLSVDLTVPIAILCVAVVLVLSARAYAAWAERRIEVRTAALLRTPGLFDDPEGPTEERSEAPSTDEEGPRA
jgi:hypothetical protein